MKKMKLTTFDEHHKRALKNPSFRKALAEADEDPFLEVAYRLITLRNEMGLTQSQLAKRIGISQQALARLESLNYKGHSLQSLHKIARSCGKKLSINFVPLKDLASSFREVRQRIGGTLKVRELINEGRKGRP